MNVAADGLLLDEVRITIDGRELLALSHHIAPGKVLSVMGASGSGKSTLLAFVAGFLAPAFRASGKVFLDGKDITGIPAHARRAGLLFQDPLLFPHMSVGGNLLFAVRGGDRAARRARVEQALADAGLHDCFDRDPATLSGGQKSRAALMRVLLSEPGALLLDEPFARLDTGLREQVRAFVFEQAAIRGLPVLLVTHDPADAAAAGGDIVVIGRT